jgi:TfoX/Sxy family transcriptional regulator of competence genes
VAHSEELAERVRRHLAGRDVVEKRMFGSLCFMLDGAMVACAGPDALLCRLRPADAADLVDRGLGRPMVMRGQPSDSYIHIDEDLLTDDVFVEWLDKAVELNHELTSR